MANRRPEHSNYQLCSGLIIILYQVNYRFLFPFCHLGKLSCAAPGVGDVGHDIVRLLDHPFVSPRDSEARDNVQ